MVSYATAIPSSSKPGLELKSVRRSGTLAISRSGKGRNRVSQPGIVHGVQAGGLTPARGLLSLPSEIIQDSYSWSPTGDFVAFLARAGQSTSLCLLGTQVGQFRYLAEGGHWFDDEDAHAITPEGSLVRV